MVPRARRAVHADEPQQKSACGVLITPDTAGVAHPVLPCGAKIYIEFGGKQVLTQVIDHGHTAPGPNL